MATPAQSIKSDEKLSISIVEDKEENDSLKKEPPIHDKKKPTEKFANLEYAAKLAEPSSRHFRSMYETFNEFFEPNRAARLKRKYEFLNRKPLE